nr:hypothetical protein [Brevundimonas diminuta]
MKGFNPTPGHHERLIVWATWFREAGYSARAIAALFNVELGALIEAGLEP